MKRLWELLFGSWVTVAEGEVDVRKVGILSGIWEETQHATVQMHTRSKRLRGSREDLSGRKEPIPEWMCNQIMVQALVKDAKAK